MLCNSRYRIGVTDSSGKSNAQSTVITVGNTRPTVVLDIPQGGVYGWGFSVMQIPWQGKVDHRGGHRRTPF